jgi:hypothetical protein
VTGPTWSRFVRFVFDNSILLVVGTLGAVAWANVDQAGYDHATHPLHFWVNDVGMVFFFALAAKEVFEQPCLVAPWRRSARRHRRSRPPSAA